MAQLPPVPASDSATSISKPAWLWDRKINLTIVSYWVICIASVYIAANRLWLKTDDTGNYLNEFNKFTGFDLAENAYEPAFTLLISFLTSLNASPAIFLFVAASIGVGTKFFAIRKYAPYLYLSLLAYYAKYYLLHEMVQVRVGIAAAIFLLSIKYIEQRRLYLTATLIGIASLFHYSALLYLSIYIACTKRISNNVYFAVLFGCATLITILNVDSQIIGLVAQHSVRMQLYIDLVNEGVHARLNLANFEYISKIGLFLILWWHRESLREQVPYFDIWMRTLATSLVAFFVLRKIPVFAFRVSELFDVVTIFLYPVVILVFRKRIVGYSLYAFLLATSFYNYYFKQGLIFL